MGLSYWNFVTIVFIVTIGHTFLEFLLLLSGPLPALRFGDTPTIDGRVFRSFGSPSASSAVQGKRLKCICHAQARRLKRSKCICNGICKGFLVDENDCRFEVKGKNTEHTHATYVVNSCRREVIGDIL